jgi:hypothetical protein
MVMGTWVYTFLKTYRQKAEGVAQVVEQLPSKCQALNSDPNTKKKKKNLQKR